MEAKIFEPSTELTDFVQCYWTLEGDKENTPLTNIIVPDGTMKLIFHYGDTYKHYPNKGESLILPKCFLIGQLTKPYVVEPTGITGSFVVRFHPNGFLPFSPVPMKKMENTAVSLNELFGEKGREIEKCILGAKTTYDRINFIEHFLLNLLKNRQAIDSVVKSTIDAILSTNGQCSVNEYSSKNKISRRHLTHKFSTAIGLNPKQLSKTIRLQAALKKLLTQEVTSLTDLAYENNYFDQAHFIKDFKEFTGLTPKEFYGNALKMSLIFDKV